MSAGGSLRDVEALLAAEGLCAAPGVDPDHWFPERISTRPVGPFAAAEAAQARAACSGCPVIAECAEYALATREEFGIWGGLAEWERDAMASRRTPARAARPVVPVEAPVWSATTVQDVLPLSFGGAA